MRINDIYYDLNVEASRRTIRSRIQGITRKRLLRSHSEEGIPITPGHLKFILTCSQCCLILYENDNES